jgi:PAS domain S-box-containing protein
MAAAPERKQPVPRAPLPALAVVGVAALVLAAAVLGRLLGVDGHAGQSLGAIALAAGAALVASALAVRVLVRRLREAEELARQSRDALRLVADWYWEQDRDFRFTYVSDSGAPVDPVVLGQRLGRAPWEIPDIGMSEAQLDRHRADLEAHRPFAGLIVRRRDPQGRTRLHSVSGEPRYTADGVFEGYRGVARDVTDEVRTQRAFAASETRYRELFESSPSPIFLHRHGVVFDANPSAARLFGFVDTEAMKGIRMADLHPPGESRQRALDRIAELEQLPVGGGVPVRDFHARTVDGRPISVQATGVRVEAAGGPATLTIMFDITARLAAEAALRRSEAMLSQLFATSPDCIILYERESGRMTLANAAFSRLTGHAVENVVGHTADELGLWHNPSDPCRLRAALDGEGRIDEMPARIATRSGRLA